MFFFTLPPLPKPPVETYQIVDVIDGDTIVTDKSQKVRLLSVDAPELDLCGGLEAKTKLESLVKGKKVKLHEVIADSYSRVVALVYQGRTSVNAEMVKSGWGKYNSINTSQSNTLLYYSRQAQDKGRGVFSPLCRQATNPENPKCLIKGNAARDNRNIYFFPGCSDYDRVIVEKNLGDRWFCTEAEAVKSGFQKSQNCYDKKF
ncbi:MAG: thermonuclease family protein [Candidatus Shapirobacteria bacterium]